MLDAREVAYSYVRDRPVLESVSTNIEPGSFLAVLGVNGCGKSTLLACLDDLLKPQGGSVLIDGEDLAQVKRAVRAEKIALVAQHSHAGRLAVCDAVLLGRKPLIKGAPTEKDLAVVDQTLEKLGLTDFALRYVDELSGGEYQKVILARAFVQETAVLLLDEPTNNLDPANQLEVMRVVRGAVDETGIAAAAVLHDVNLALRYCDRFLMMKDGRVAASGGSDIVTEDSVHMVYGITADVIEHNGRKVVIPS